MGKKNRLNHVEFRTRDQARLKAFYSAAFGWKWQPYNDSYTMIDFGNDQVTGGLGAAPPSAAGEPPLPTGTTAFFTVEDLAAAEAKIKEAGGRVLLSRQPAGQGWCSYFVDPDQNVGGIWQAESKKDRKEKKEKEKAEKKAKEAKSVVEVKPAKPESVAVSDKVKKDKKNKKDKKSKEKKEHKEGHEHRAGELKPL